LVKLATNQNYSLISCLLTQSCDATFSTGHVKEATHSDVDYRSFALNDGKNYTAFGRIDKSGIEFFCPCAYYTRTWLCAQVHAGLQHTCVHLWTWWILE